MFRFLTCAVMRALYAACSCVSIATLLHAEPAALWNYKGSVVELTPTGSEIIIVFKKPSDLLLQSGAQPGDVLFQGERLRDALSGTFYKFYGKKCGSRGFHVSGTIEEGRRISVSGQAPVLGANCEPAGTSSDILSLSAIANTESDRAEAAANDMTATKMNAGLCKTAHDLAACDAALASPLVSNDVRKELLAARALATSAPRSVFLKLPFVCVFENGKPAIKETEQPYFHEALDYRPSQSYTLCSAIQGSWGATIRPLCSILELSSYRLVCKDGIATTPYLSLATKEARTKPYRVENGSLMVPVEKNFSLMSELEGFHRLPQGWGIVPRPLQVGVIQELETLFDNPMAPVTGSPPQALPHSFFLTLAGWSPLPYIVALAIFLTAAGVAGFGFSLYPDSPLSPRRPVFWIWLVIAAYSLSSALSAGDAINEAFHQGQSQAAAIAKDQTRLQSLLPPKRDGHIEPFPSRDLDAVKELQRPRTIINAAAVAADAPTRVFFYLLPALLFLAVYARFIFAGYHYLFVRHPAEEIAAPALRSGDLFDKEKLADALAVSVEEFDQHPPLHETENQVRRAQALRDRIEVDGDIAEAAMRRDRARAAQVEAEKDLREARKKLPWWQRLFTRWA